MTPLNETPPDLRRRRPLRAVVLGALAFAGIAALADIVPVGDPVRAELAGMGIAVTGGAAPGYVPDATCALCHDRIAQSYAEVGMARSFVRPRADRFIEDFSAPPFHHERSRQFLAIVRRGDGLVFRRFQRDAAGREIHLFEQPIDWILGSGNHARVYLYRTPDGALFQLPLAWYTQEKRWGMAPGDDRPDHDGVLRRIRRECMACHNAYPDVPAGSDRDGQPHVFPAELPEGTGCQRCHGPGGEHVRRAMGGIELRERIRAAIVNPARLSPARRDDVCNGCHLEPLVALAGARRLERGDYAFRPGEVLADHTILVDATEEGGGEVDRFEINHHAVRLRESRCFVASAGRLSCLTCHDPHRKLTEDRLAEKVRIACQSCHPGGDACKRPRTERLATGSPDTADCASCHMPKRRPRDVVHVVMTDHRIRRTPGGPELLAPREEGDPVLTGVSLYPSGGPSDPDPLPPPLAEIYRTLPVVRLGTSDDAVRHLERLVATLPAPSVELKLELAEGELRRRRYREAEAILAALESSEPASGRLLWLLGQAREGAGRGAVAEEAYRRALLRTDVDRAEVATRLGLLLLRTGRAAEALPLFTDALAERPNLAVAWRGRALAETALGQESAAQESTARASAIDPP